MFGDRAKMAAEIEMATYDKLPPAVRLALQNSDYPPLAQDLIGFRHERHMLEHISDFEMKHRTENV